MKNLSSIAIGNGEWVLCFELFNLDQNEQAVCHQIGLHSRPWKPNDCEPVDTQPIRLLEWSSSSEPIVISPTSRERVITIARIEFSFPPQDIELFFSFKTTDSLLWQPGLSLQISPLSNKQEAVTIDPSSLVNCNWYPFKEMILIVGQPFNIRLLAQLIQSLFPSFVLAMQDEGCTFVCTRRFLQIRVETTHFQCVRVTIRGVHQNEVFLWIKQVTDNLPPHVICIPDRLGQSTIDLLKKVYQHLLNELNLLEEWPNVHVRESGIGDQLNSHWKQTHVLLTHQLRTDLLMSTFISNSFCPDCIPNNKEIPKI